MRTFSVGFPEPRYDERRYARSVAERFGTEHEELLVEPDAAALLPRLADAFDEPFGDTSALPTYLVCEHARRFVTVALVGDGGDEIFGGYERYRAHALAQRLDRLPGGIASLAASGIRRLPSGRTRAALGAVPRGPLPRHRRPRSRRALRPADAVFPRELRQRLWTEDALARDRRAADGRVTCSAPPARAASPGSS